MLLIINTSYDNLNCSNVIKINIRKDATQMLDINKITELLSEIEMIFLIIIPAVIAVFIKIRNKVKQKSKAIKKIENKKAQEKYNAWLHDESRRAILKIKELCNVYKDRSHADQVIYIQLENGTTATSKLHNMFVTCLAEDSRYGEISKKIFGLQRIPYSQVAEWIEELSKTSVIIPDTQLIKEKWHCPVMKEAASHISMSVFNENGYFIGIVVFNYKNINFNGAEESQQLNLIENFKTSLETVFISYHVSQRDKMKELNISDEKEESSKFFI